jgi:YbgC/YbaW family acyl-CoA thioester hydrolase
MKPLNHEYRLLIVEGHLDTFGHVNNAKYLELFEEARWDLITARGYGIEKIRETRLGPVILEARLKFRREVRNRENILIRSELVSYERTIATLLQRLEKEDGSLACEATFLIGLWDIDERKLVLPTPEWSKAVMMTEELS